MMKKVMSLVVFFIILKMSFSADFYYGPLPNRKIPSDKEVNYFVSVNGNDKNDGKTRETAFATIQKAIDLVKPGETILVMKGKYHQSFHINKKGAPGKWINIIAEKGVVIDGAERRTDWIPSKDKKGVYYIQRPNLLRTWQKPDTPLKNRLEQVFWNGKLLRQVPRKEMLRPNGTFYVDDKERKMYVCFKEGKNPNEEIVEVTTLTYAIAIGGEPNRNWVAEPEEVEKNSAAYIRIDGFTIRRIANFTRMGAIQVRGDCNHIIIENCNIQWANYSGIAVSNYTVFDKTQKKWFFYLCQDIIIRHNIISNNGGIGIGGGGASNLLIEYNIIDNNNYKGHSVWWEGGGIKLGFRGKNVTIRHNVVRNNDNHGIWFDYASTGCVIENNFIYNSIAGGILNEVTVAPDTKFENNGKKSFIVPDSKYVKTHKQKGTVIRNNIIIGTKVPGGGGINLSNSTDTEVYNNITFLNNGGGINLGGSPTRPNTRGSHRNKIYSNVSYEDFYGATRGYFEKDDKTGRTFDNVFYNNVYIKSKAENPLSVKGIACDLNTWDKYNKGYKNYYYKDLKIFKNPYNFDFTLTEKGLEIAKKIGFNPDALKLNWTEFYMPKKETKTMITKKGDKFFPINLLDIFNRSLYDKVAGDGKGGWSDQGPNDLSKFPTGKQIFNGVEYLIGPIEKGALLLSTTRVKPNIFPEEVEKKIGDKFNSLWFLYTSAWTPKGNTELARFYIYYKDGEKVEIPVISGIHIFDWWSDPAWNDQMKLNERNVFIAWQGPNRQVGKVTVYQMKWENPYPEKVIDKIIISNKNSKDKNYCFFLLGITGVKHSSKGISNGERKRVFYMSFDGHIFVVNSEGNEIDGKGYTKLCFDAGKFTKGIKDAAYIPKKPVYYPVPEDFPLKGEGTISLWLKADDWRTPERKNLYKKAPYTKVMWPFAAESSKKRYSVWQISFNIGGKNFENIEFFMRISGPSFKKDITDLIKPNEWFNILVRWYPDKEKKGHTVYEVFFNGKLLLKERKRGIPDAIGDRIYIGVPKNGGQPWRGAMDELSIWNYSISEKEIINVVKEGFRLLHNFDKNKNNNI